MHKPTRSEIQDHKRFLKRQQVYERTYRKQFYAYLNSVNISVAKWIVENDSIDVDITGFLNYDRVESIYKRLYNRVTINEAKIAWGELPSDRKDIIDTFADFFSGLTSDEGTPIRLWRQLLNDFITVRIASRITEVDTTTQNRIAHLIEDGIDKGLGAREVAKTIRDDRGYNRNRSLAIARTETITAMNQGKYLAAKSSPYVMEKRWLPTLDARTRPSHADFYDRPWIDLEAIFWVANAYGVLEPAQYPGDGTLSASNVVNCRCALQTRAKRGSNGRLIRKENTI